MRLVRWAIVLVTLSMSAPSHGQDSQAELEEEFYRAQFAGWGGILFRCYQVEGSKPGQRICRDMATDAGFLAAAADVPFFDGTGRTLFSAIIDSHDKFQDPLVLEATVMVAGEGYIAVSVRLEAGSNYNNAVDKGDSSGPESLPKGGTLVLWENGTVASGSGDDLYRALRDGNETLLKQFFTHFVAHWTGPEKK